MNEEMLGLVDLLDEQLDDLTEALQPLLTTPLQDISSKLPVVDKARISVLTTYAIESLLFSYLRLNGVNAKEHPVMRELARVRQYVQKINEAQAGPAKREVVLNKGVAGRFVKHGLAGNEKWDRERAEQQAKERAGAHIKFEELSRKIERREAEEQEGQTDGVSGEDEMTQSDLDEHMGKRKKSEHRLDLLLDQQSRNEEQVNRILDTFKSHGVATGGSKRKHDGKDRGANDGKKKVYKPKRNKDQAGTEKKIQHRAKKGKGAEVDHKAGTKLEGDKSKDKK